MTLPSSWHADWSGLKAVVLGLGKSGFSVVDTLIELGVTTTAIAGKVDDQIRELTEVIGGEIVLGESAELIANLGSVDFAVVSPGYRPDHPQVLELGKRGIEIYTDVDLAYRLRDKTARVSRWITITGTNGKTTTTELTAHILRTSGLRAIACGNIGNPILDAIRDPEGFDFLVVELSSFQLHYGHPLSAEASAFLNFAEDHLDWHGSEQAYFESKAKIYSLTQKAIVFNEQDKKTLAAAEQADVIEGARAVSFTLGIPARSMIGYVEEFLVDRAFLDERADAALEIAQDSDLEKIGPLTNQLRQNVAAATALARAVDVPAGVIKHAIATFELAPHRVQLVLEKDGIRFVDDSKATNAHAANASLSSFDSVIWLVGGLLKGVDISPLITEHASRLKAAVIIGKDTNELTELFSKLLPTLPLRVLTGETMSEAVKAAIEIAQTGDTVLLAPAAASMDQYRDYTDRGNQFQQAVREQA